MRNIVVLDACALIAYIKDEEGADIVADVIDDAEAGRVVLLINRINLLEIYYDLYRSKGEAYARNIMHNIMAFDIRLVEFTEEIFFEAGRFKASYKMSLADSIAIATAEIKGGELLTADHHEFDPIEAAGTENIRFHWIR